MMTEAVRAESGLSWLLAVQWSVVGVVALYAMWLAHLALFRGNGMANWIGVSVRRAKYLHLGTKRNDD
jgi:O-antigen ligase